MPQRSSQEVPKEVPESQHVAELDVFQYCVVPVLFSSIWIRNTIKGPETPSQASKRPGRTPTLPKRASGRGCENPKTAHDSAKMAQEAPRAPGCAKTAQKVPGTSQEAPNVSEGHHNPPPRSPQDAPLRAPRQPYDTSGRSTRDPYAPSQPS